MLKYICYVHTQWFYYTVPSKYVFVLDTLINPI